VVRNLGYLEAYWDSFGKATNEAQKHLTFYKLQFCGSLLEVKGCPHVSLIIWIMTSLQGVFFQH
jgi:hypothetical protein